MNVTIKHNTEIFQMREIFHNFIFQEIFKLYSNKSALLQIIAVPLSCLVNPSRFKYFKIKHFTYSKFKTYLI